MAYLHIDNRATTVRVLNNGGDIGKTLEQLGRDENVKNLLIAMTTAGVGTAVAGQGVRAVAAQTAAGCMTGAVSGAGCQTGAKTAAVLSGAGEAYRSWVGYAADAGPGDNRFGTKLDGTSTKDGTYQENPATGQQLPADRGMNVIGHNEPERILSQGGTASRALNNVPFVNATAGLHDYIFNANPSMNSKFAYWNIPTMLPSAAIAIPAALNDPSYSWLTQVNTNVPPRRPPASSLNTRRVMVLIAPSTPRKLENLP